MVTIILLLALGLGLGWIMSVVMHERSGLALNMVVGVVGSLGGGLSLWTPITHQDAFNATALLMSCIGAVVLLSIVTLIRRVGMP